MSTTYAGDRTATQSPSAAPSAGGTITVSLPVGADAFSVSAWYQAHKVAADFIDFLLHNAMTGTFGDASDGDDALDGTNPALTSKITGPVSGVYTATSDLFFRTLTVGNAGTVLKMNGYRLYVSVELTTTGGAKITADGNDGVANAAGAQTATGTIGHGAAGGAGSVGVGTGANGSNGGFGGAGGAGGTGSGGGGGGGAGGTAATPSAAQGSLRLYSPPMFGQLVSGTGITAVHGGSGGGGGGLGTGGSGASGGGGSGGGVLAIAARKLTLDAASALRARGGNGGNGVTANSGGGGGGGGGLLLLAYCNKGGTSFSAATNCPGGAVGTSSATTSPFPVAGSNGQVIEIQLGGV